jgi:uncharacterized protein (TIGR04255 family)
MAINEVFPNPTVKRVIFQIRYPNLFYIEDKIGALQMKLMKEFPESSLLYEQKLRITDKGFNLEKSSDEKPGEVIKKIWSFESAKKTRLNILSDSIDISSEFHKTYNNPDSANRFRDVIDLVLKPFFEATQIPIVKRIGLRYVDECPIPKKDTKIFKEYYKTTFPLGRFNLEDATDMNFSTVVKRGKYNLRFVEKLVRLGKKYKLILDFDGFGANIPSQNCLKVTDDLHDLILKEYKKSIKEPVYRHMRTKSRKKK